MVDQNQSGQVICLACCATLADRIRERDGETCSICGENHDLDVHHVIPSYKGGSDDVHNLITLCHKCHRNKHRELKPPSHRGIHSTNCIMTYLLAQNVDIIKRPRK